MARGANKGQERLQYYTGFEAIIRGKRTEDSLHWYRLNRRWRRLWTGTNAYHAWSLRWLDRRLSDVLALPPPCMPILSKVTKQRQIENLDKAQTFVASGWSK